jgi:hypothetical protein
MVAFRLFKGSFFGVDKLWLNQQTKKLPRTGYQVKSFTKSRPLPILKMTKAYKIQFPMPADYNPASLFNRMPSPIHRQTMSEIYNYRIENDGFYFVDSSVDTAVAAVAFRLFVDEALTFGSSIEIHAL